MVKITYDYCTKVIIIFDDEFEIKMTDDLDGIREKIEWAFNKYDFEYASVISAETGEVVMGAFREED